MFLMDYPVWFFEVPGNENIFPCCSDKLININILWKTEGISHCTRFLFFYT